MNTRRPKPIVQLELSLKPATIGLNAYLTKTDDPFLQMAEHHEQSKEIYFVTKKLQNSAISLTFQKLQKF